MLGKLIKFSVSNKVFSNLVMLLIFAFGIYAYVNIRFSLYPDVEHACVQVFTEYPGAQPEIVERELTDPFEDEINKIDDVDLVFSLSMENMSAIYIRLKINVDDVEKVTHEIRRRIYALDFPERAERPNVRTASYSMVPVVYIGLTGGETHFERVRAAELLEKELQTVKGTSHIELFGETEREIHVEIDPVRLAGYGLSMNTVAQALRSNNVDIPGGSLKHGTEEYTLRLKGRFTAIKDIRETILFTPGSAVATAGKRSVEVKDVAAVYEKVREGKVRTHFDGEEAIIFNVYKSKKVDSIRLIDDIRASIEHMRGVVPADIEITIFNDSSKDIKRLLGILESNSILGLVFVVITLWLIIGWRQALFAALGIPFSFAFVTAYLFSADYSMNQITLFGMILALGMVVDDAIVVIENVYRWMEKGIKPHLAAINGAKEIAVPVISASLTTIAAFLPAALLGGPIGRVMKFIPIVVCVILVGSLIECFLVLPSHLADGGRTSKRSVVLGRRLKRRITKMAKWMLRYGVVVVIVFILLAAGACAFLAMHARELFSNEDLRTFRVGIETAAGTKVDETSRVVNHCAGIINERYGAHCNAVVSYGGLLEADMWQAVSQSNSNEGQVLVELADSAQEGLSYYIEKIRKDLSSVAGIQNLKFIKMENAPVAGKDVNIVIRADELDRARTVAAHIKDALSHIKGVKEIEDDYREGKEELRINVDSRRAARYQLTREAIGHMVYRAFEGEKVGIYQDKDKDIDIILRLRADHRKRIADLRNLKLATPTGATVKLCEVAEIGLERGPALISHYDSRRSVTVRANVNSDVVTQDEVNIMMSEIFPELERRYPGCTIRHTGEFEDLEESFKDLKWALFFALFMVYLVLGTQFKSFWQPFLIMLVIPFSLIGVAASLFIGQSPLSIMIFIGIIGLTGVVVNDSLILIDFLNKGHARGETTAHAVLNGIATRARPVIFTSVTTIAGLLPAAIGLSGKTVVWQPLAQTFIGGLFVSTFSTLFVVPILYVWLKRAFGKKR